MTITFPSSRNSFHPAWLLLVVPPLVSLGLIWWNQNPPVYIGQVIRLSLVLLLVGPLLWMRSGPVGGRTQRLLKEVRALLPGCLLAVLVPGGLAMVDEREAAGFAVWGYGLGCLLMGASTFGGEFEQRTMATLLGQPLPRSVVFAEKIGTLGSLLALATANLLLSLILVPGQSYASEAGGEMLLVPVFVLCSGPFFSLISRSTLAALIFTLTVPMILCGIGALGLELVQRFGHPGETFSEVWSERLVWIGTPIYLVATAMLGWRTFRNLEVREGGAGGRGGTALHPLSRPVDAVLRRLFPVPGGTVQLVRKELRLHVVPWLMAGLMIGLWLLWLTLRHFAQDEDFRSTLNQASALTVFAGILGTLVVVGAGAACVAEERELGTLEWQLTQPVSVSRQWWIKVAVTMALSLGLGILLPVLLLWLGFDRGQLGGESDEQAIRVGVILAGLFFMASATSIYASSISRNTMKATAAAVGLAAGFATVITTVAGSITANLDQTFSGLPEKWQAMNAGKPDWAPSQELLAVLGMAFPAILVLGFVAGLLWLGGQNCRRQVVPVRDVVRQFAGMTLGLLVCLGIFGAIAGQLMVLKQQESWFEMQRMERSNAVATVRGLASSGKLTPEIYGQFNVPTNASPLALTDAILATRGRDAVQDLARQLTQPPQATGYGLGPVMARRYGLISGKATVSPGTNVPAPQPPAAAAGKFYSMDPAMARRYGLTPATNAPATNSPAPAPSGK